MENHENHHLGFSESVSRAITAREGLSAGGLFLLLLNALGLGIVRAIEHELPPIGTPYVIAEATLILLSAGLTYGMKSGIARLYDRCSGGWTGWRQNRTPILLGRSANVTGDLWDEYYGKAKEIDLLGHGMNGLIAKTKGRKSLTEALERGATVRMLLLDPDSAHAAEVARRLKAGDDLIKKILDSLNQAEGIRQTDHKGRLDIRVTSDVVYSRMCRFDDTILATLYSNDNEPGDNGVILNVKRGGPFSELYEFFFAEFKRLWANSDEFRGRCLGTPPAGRNVFALYDVARQAREALAFNQLDHSLAPLSLPLPRMAILYPTYDCGLNCDYCAYRPLRGPARSMSVSLWKWILHDLCGNGVKHIELSGGGEPLEACELMTLFEELPPLVAQGMHFGLLTNGLNLSSELIDAIVPHFAYVRLSYGDAIALNPVHNQKFLDRLDKLLEKRLLEHKRDEHASIPRVGVKMLLTKNLLDADGALERMIDAVGGRSIDHLKIQSASGPHRPAEAENPALHRKLSRLLQRHKNIDEITIDIERFVVPAGHQCWLGGCVATIDPSGNVYPCINYSCLGNFAEHCVGSFGPAGGKSIKDIWKADRVAHSLNTFSTVCPSESAVNCRFARYQKSLSQIMTFEDVVTRAKQPAQVVKLPGFY